MRTPFFNHERACVWILWGIFPSLILKQITLFRISKNQNRAQLGQSMCRLNMWQMQRKLQRCHYKCLWRYLRGQMLLFHVFHGSECVLWSPSKEEVWFNMVRNRKPPNLFVVVCIHWMTAEWVADTHYSGRKEMYMNLLFLIKTPRHNYKEICRWCVLWELSCLKSIIYRCVLP